MIADPGQEVNGEGVADVFCEVAGAERGFGEAKVEPSEWDLGFGSRMTAVESDGRIPGGGAGDSDWQRCVDE